MTLLIVPPKDIVVEFPFHATHGQEYRTAQLFADRTSVIGRRSLFFTPKNDKGIRLVGDCQGKYQGFDRMRSTSVYECLLAYECPEGDPGLLLGVIQSLLFGITKEQLNAFVLP